MAAPAMFANPLDPALDIRCAAIEAACLTLLRYFAPDEGPEKTSLSIEATRDIDGSHSIILTVSSGDVATFGVSL